jgi:DedD protein
MAEPADINVDELRRRARRRLVGAVVLALGVAVVVPMLLETEQKPLGEDVSVKIPPIDDGKFVNRLSENRAKESASAPAKGDAAKEPAPVPAPPAPTTTAAPPKYDTRIPDAMAPGASVVAPSAAPESATAAKAAEPRPAPPTVASTTAVEPAKAVAPATRPDAKSAGPGAATAAAAGAAKAASPAQHDGFAVQLAAFADDKGANALAGRLKKGGYSAYTEPLKTSKGTLWRVRVGPYPSREAAVAARDKLKTEGQSGIVAAVK